MNILEMYNVFMYLQVNFDKNMCDTIFDDLSDHLFDKWLRCNYNILNFISMLDNGNRIKLIDWGIKNYDV